MNLFLSILFYRSTLHGTTPAPVSQPELAALLETTPELLLVATTEGITIRTRLRHRTEMEEVQQRQCVLPPLLSGEKEEKKKEA